jgi:hypothetical protein
MKLGCQREHLHDCFRIAYATNRVLIYTADRVRYIKNFTEIYHALSETCTETMKDEEKIYWPGKIIHLYTSFPINATLLNAIISTRALKMLRNCSNFYNLYLLIID